ncbi:MAG: hypothetical protein A2Y14_05030 [Verrucomicrobia bacterium GWF2_51_19]|nr:MAG: hypothetical protein A2Y14_05030 [Verrucomicrobia bacterium GWF2_51_19]HCJ11773.1 hypothetical protein [Opitutae bacterium]
MLPSIKKITSFLLASGLLCVAHGGPTIKVGSFVIPKLVEGRNAGTHVNVLREIEKRTGITCILEILPTKNTQQAFRDKVLDAYFPAVPQSTPDFAIKTEAYTPKRMYVYGLKDKPVITQVAELSGKTVGLISGYSYGEAISQAIKENKFTPSYFDLDTKCLNALLVGKVDYWVAEVSSGGKTIDVLIAKDKVSYDVNKPIAEIPIYFAFQPEKKAEAEAFSKAIIEMKKDGTMAKLLN